MVRGVNPACRIWSLYGSKHLGNRLVFGLERGDRLGLACELAVLPLDHVADDGLGIRRELGVKLAVFLGQRDGGLCGRLDHGGRIWRVRVDRRGIGVDDRLNNFRLGLALGLDELAVGAALALALGCLVIALRSLAGDLFGLGRLRRLGRCQRTGER
jgi:hypothetical protein